MCRGIDNGAVCYGDFAATCYGIMEIIKVVCEVVGGT